jgi:DNA polymerase-3 subunit gamma/tau
MVRFLRNATVAKIAGKDSMLLQISNEERERVARVADLFGEEDLTRHLQIMLRTHGELGYKQEQRFHLELGLLKMAHAQKLLPIEQLLSEVSAAPPASAQKPLARPSIVGSQASAGTRTEQPARPNFVSPFAADSARKGTPRQEDSGSPVPPPGPRIVAQASQQEPVIMGSAAPATAPQPDAEPLSNHREVTGYVSADAATAAVQVPQPAEQPQPSLATHTPEDQIEKLRVAVLQALADGNQNFLASLLSGGEWTVEGNELVIKIAESQTVLDMSLGNDAKRLAIASASGVLGRAVKLRVVPGASVGSQPKRNGGPPPSSGSGGRGRAEQDPVVRRMREKFGAEIRTVIDYRDKR